MHNAVNRWRNVARLAASADEVQLSIRRLWGAYWLLQWPPEAQAGATPHAAARRTVARAATALAKVWEGVQQLRVGSNDAASRWGSRGAPQQRAELGDDITVVAVALDQMVRQLQVLQGKLQGTERQWTALGRPPSRAVSSSLSHVEEIPLVKVGGVYALPVDINGVFTSEFVLDTGAADVNLPANVVLRLRQSGTIKATDFLPGKPYTLADGSTVQRPRVLLRSLTLGHRRVPNVAASIGPVDSMLLLGQNFLEHLGAWGMDSQRRVLTLGIHGQRTEIPLPPASLGRLPWGARARTWPCVRRLDTSTVQWVVRSNMGSTLVKHLLEEFARAARRPGQAGLSLHDRVQSLLIGCECC